MNNIEKLFFMSKDELGPKLKKIRLEHNYSLADLSEASGLDSAVLSKIENSHRLCNDFNLIKILRVYKLNLGEFEDKIYSFNNLELSKWLKSNLENLWITVSELSMLTGVTSSCLNNYIKGNFKHIPFDKLYVIKKTFNEYKKQSFILMDNDIFSFSHNNLVDYLVEVRKKLNIKKINLAIGVWGDRKYLPTVINMENKKHFPRKNTILKIAKFLKEKEHD